MAGESKEVPELGHNGGLSLTTTEIHVVTDVVRDGAGVLTSSGNSRRATLGEILAMLPARITFQVLGTTPSAGEILALYPAAVAFTIPANFAGSKGSIISNPAADFAVTIARQVNGAGAFATIGTITFKTDGTMTWATAGGVAIAIAAGDVIKATGDGDGDGAFNGAATIVGH